MLAFFLIFASLDLWSLSDRENDCIEGLALGSLLRWILGVAVPELVEGLIKLSRDVRSLSGRDNDCIEGNKGLPLSFLGRGNLASIHRL